MPGASTLVIDQYVIYCERVRVSHFEGVTHVGRGQGQRKERRAKARKGEGADLYAKRGDGGSGNGGGDGSGRRRTSRHILVWYLFHFFRFPVLYIFVQCARRRVSRWCP